MPMWPWIIASDRAASKHANDGRPTQILAGSFDVLVQMRSSRRAPRNRGYKAFTETNRLKTIKIKFI